MPAAVEAAGLSAQTRDDVADESVQLELRLLAEVRRSSGRAGRETHHFVPARHLSQGEVVYYTVRIRNPTTEYMPKAVVVQKIPANTSYVAGSAAAPGAQVMFSIDGGESFGTPEQLQVNVEGRMQPASPARYTHVRWQLRNALAPGAVALARFQAIFD